MTKPKLTVVEGTDVPIWDDPNSVERVLQAALGRKDDSILYAFVCTMDQDGTIKAYSNSTNSVIILGMMDRSRHIINTNIDYFSSDVDAEKDDDPA